MILSDKDIKQRLNANDTLPASARGPLKIEPLGDFEKQIQPASVDLRLGHAFIRVRKSHVGVVDLANPEQELDRVQAHKSFVVEPGEFVLASTIERVTMPYDLVGRVDGRSSLGRLGLVVHVTAGFIDPGFDGNITLEMTNLNPSPLRLHVGLRVCQLSLHRLTSVVERPYGKARGSKYHGESATGAVPSLYRK